jgi:preprotein translocase subunit SecF
VAGLLALVHDVLITLGFFALTRVEVNSAFVAALLTVVGYSINDTIIVFDRIRENLRVRKEDLGSLVDRSINETLLRSINTAGTTLIAVIALLIFGAPTIRDFTLALLVGIASGTYSSIFIASPIWYEWKIWDRKRERAAAMVPKK